MSSPFSLWECSHYPCSVHHGNGPRFKTLVRGRKEQSGSLRISTSQPLWLGGGGRSGRGEPAPHCRSGGARRDRAHGRDGQRTLPAAGGVQPARRHRELLQVATVKERCGDRQRNPGARVTSRSVGNDPGSSNLMDQSGKNPKHGQEEDWQFIGSTGCGRL